ncbi:MAG: alpha/beta fold hydrolase [Deltaproteobacteria bacterium]|nr:alpha/beta fold hydrolase [Deltaproteobacteria bacterium]
MTERASEVDLLTNLRREVERNALRARNGLRYLAGGRFVRTGATPRDLVWHHGKTELWRYRSERRTRRPPLLAYLGLVARSYVFDLFPGNSFVAKLLANGFDVFLLDWGVPDEAEASNTIATYSLELLPRAVEAALDAAEESEITLLGYCMGGCLTLASMGAGGPLPARSLILMATPTDFSKMGDFFEPMRNGSFDPETAIDETGNVPASLVRGSFRVRKPTSDLVVYANLWQNLWNDAYMEGFQAMNEWVNDQVPFPGAAFREFVSEWLIGNGLVNHRLHVGGRKVDLGRIRVPVLCLIAEQDDIVPLAAAEPLPGLLTGADVQTVRLPAGHINLATGRQADRVTIPSIIDFLDRHATPRAA